MRNQRARYLAAAGNLAAVHVAVGRVVAEDQFRVRSVGVNGPQRVAEIGPLVQVFRTRPEDAAVAHHRRRPFAQIGERKRAQLLALSIHAEEHERLGTPAKKAAAAPGGDERQAAVGQGTGIVVVERSLRQLPHRPPFGVHHHQVPIAVPVGGRALARAIREVNPLGIEIGNRIAGDAPAGVEQRDQPGLLRLEAAVPARDLQDANSAAGTKLGVENIAVVVRRPVRMPLHEQYPCQQGQVRIAKHQPPLGRAGIQIERCGGGLRSGALLRLGRRGQRRMPPPQVGQLASLASGLHSLGRQTLDHFFHLCQDAQQRIQPRDAAPVRRTAGQRGTLDLERRKMVAGRNSQPRRSFTQECVTQQPCGSRRFRQRHRRHVGRRSIGACRPSARLQLADGLPLLPVQGKANLDRQRHAILIVSLAIPRKDHLGHPGWRGQFDLRPLVLAAGRNPAMRIAVFAVVEVLDPVDCVAGQARRSRGSGAGLGQGKILFSTLSVNLQLVETRLPATGGKNHEPDEPGLSDGKGDFICGVRRESGRRGMPRRANGQDQHPKGRNSPLQQAEVDHANLPNTMITAWSNPFSNSIQGRRCRYDNQP